MHALPAPYFQVTELEIYHADRSAERGWQNFIWQMGGHKSDDPWDFQCILAGSQPGLSPPRNVGWRRGVIPRVDEGQHDVSGHAERRWLEKRYRALGRRVWHHHRSDLPRRQEAWSDVHLVWHSLHCFRGQDLRTRRNESRDQMEGRLVGVWNLWLEEQVINSQERRPKPLQAMKHLSGDHAREIK